MLELAHDLLGDPDDPDGGRYRCLGFGRQVSDPDRIRSFFIGTSRRRWKPPSSRPILLPSQASRSLGILPFLDDSCPRCGDGIRGGDAGMDRVAGGGDAVRQRQGILCGPGGIHVPWRDRHALSPQMLAGSGAGGAAQSSDARELRGVNTGEDDSILDDRPPYG